MKNKKTPRQLSFTQKGLKPERSDHGGSLKNPQKRKRPLGLRSSMHLVLRSSKAKNEWSFRRHKKAVHEVLRRFSDKYGVEIISLANVGNHLHLHLRVSNRKWYCAFIRAITSAIRTKVSGYSRWRKAPKGFQFWDLRPFSRIVSTWSEFLNLRRYIEINRWEGAGRVRQLARQLVARGVLVPDSG